MPVVLSIIFFCLLACKRLFEDGSWQTTPEEKNSNIVGPDVERLTSTIRTSEEFEIYTSSERVKRRVPS